MCLTQLPTLRFARLIALVPLCVAFAYSCGGGSSAPPSYYTIGGTVHGLAGSGLVLQDNGGGDLAVATNGSFKFGTTVASGHSYLVTVAAQPSNPSQACIVSSSSGVVTSGAVTNVFVNCTNSYAVGGTVTGLSGSGLGLGIQRYRPPSRERAGPFYIFDQGAERFRLPHDGRVSAHQSDSKLHSTKRQPRRNGH